MKKILLFFLCLFSTSTAFAQWEEVYRTDSYVFGGLYFLDDDLGFALYNGYDHFYKTNDGFETSEFLQIPEVYNIEEFTFYDSLNGLALGPEDNLHKTKDGGQSWSVDLLGVDEPLYLESMFTIGRDTIYVGGRKLLRSTNGGESWETIAEYSTLFGNHGETMYERETLIDFKLGGGQRNLFITNYFVYRTSDDGENLNPLPLPVKEKNILSHYFVDSYVEGNSVYVLSNSRGYPKKLFKSHDLGNTWQVIELPLNDYISINGVSTDTVFISGDKGVLLETTNGFNNWTKTVIDPDTQINDVLFTKNKTGYLVTNQRIYRNNRFRVITSSEDKHPTKARGISLEQNYPNPFNPTTNIRFTLSQPSNVVISVYNILGRKVDQLYSGFKSTGNHTITFDASQLSGGIYFYELKTSSFAERKKMTLIK